MPYHLPSVRACVALCTLLLQGLEGVVHSCTSPAPTVPTSSGGTSPVAAPLPPPMRYIALQQLGPMRLPRLWSALHDALMYADPKAAVGGKVGWIVHGLRTNAVRP